MSNSGPGGSTGRELPEVREARLRIGEHVRRAHPEAWVATDGPGAPRTVWSSGCNAWLVVAAGKLIGEFGTEEEADGFIDIMATHSFYDPDSE